ncbi:MAG: acetolactate decarboxylase [Nitrospinae bacterium]|nr:acetolactate decarboxylase [Nitrospinota bacterium]
MSAKKLVVALIICFGLSGYAAGGDSGVYQVGVVNALSVGVLEGDVTIGELKREGDTGIGTFNGLDGEMAVADGVVYQIKSDGVAIPAGDTLKTPFATVTMFAPDREVKLASVESFTNMAAQLDKALPTLNAIYAVRIDGKFEYLKARSVPGQKRPYPTLNDVVKQQTVFTYESVEGTLVGFRFPSYMKSVNVPGWHLHYLTKDRKRGGHALDLRAVSLTAKLSTASRHTVKLFYNADFNQADLAGAGEYSKSFAPEK